MIFKIEHLGILEQAEIDLSKDLILLCGHNNTGKTYLAYAIYHFLTFKPLAKECSDWSSNLVEQSLSHQNGGKTKQTIDLLEVWRSITKKVFLTSIANQFQETLGEFFALPNHTSFSETKLILEISEEEISTALAPRTTVLKSPVQTIIDCLFNFNGYIAPAERAAINIFSQELSLNKNQLLDLVLKAEKHTDRLLELLRNRVNRYPRPIRDNLAIAEDLVNLAKNHSEFSYLADELEHDLLQGTITISEAGEVKYMPANATEQQLAVHLTSSLVKSLSGLVFYLRHLAKPKDFILIDEPELNLHPDNQRLIARFLGRLVNVGFKVIISTHSDYIVREINNLIMLSQPGRKAAKLRKEYGYAKHQLLKPEQIGAYLFRHTCRSSEVIPVTDTGLEIATIDEVVAKLNKSSQNIYFGLFD
jgi:hypothetical protein